MECAGEAECVDDPSDTCNPSTNGDCPGTCECGVILPCNAGEVFDDDPTVCGCVPDVIEPDPCEGVICPTGTVCVEQPDGTPACEPSP
jgi:hypothetical protein